jgi:hydroxymethylglutaryl-CoA lyase
MITYPAEVRITEVGPRDGLQNASGVVSTADKITLIEQLEDAGITAIETGLFVRKVPKMADSGDVNRGLRKNPGVTRISLVPNLKGLEAALASGAETFAVFAAATESFSLKNIDCSIDDSLARYRLVLDEVKKQKPAARVRGYVSCVLGCPDEGEVKPAAVVRVAKALHDMGCYEISLGDTIGTGTPVKTYELLQAVKQEVPVSALAVHFHDTYGQALSNILAALDEGITSIDSSVAGLGGCPYAKGATGNVATEEVLYMLHGMGVKTGVDLDKVAAAGRFITSRLGQPIVSKVGQVLALRGAKP